MISGDAAATFAISQPNEPGFDIHVDSPESRELFDALATEE